MVVLLKPTQAAGLSGPAFLRQAGARISHGKDCFTGWNNDHEDIDFACK
jgi:hypothetical protein